MEYAEKSDVCDESIALEIQKYSRENDSEKKENSKRLRGQFFTTTNPFVNEAFIKWFKKTPPNTTLLEPFAGANNIVWMIRDIGFKNEWVSFDIDPCNRELQNAAPDVPVIARDTIVDFPKGYKVVITNPPYLAKNSASRRGLDYVGGRYDDLYKKSLEVMLANSDFVAAIIPESFINQDCFRDRLDAVVSLTCRMFDDTEVPVCLALFSPLNKKDYSDDFTIWSGSRNISTYLNLKLHIETPEKRYFWRFNEPAGLIGLLGVDATAKGGLIKFVMGDEIDSDSVKQTSRANTRIHLDGLSKTMAGKVVSEANRILKNYRKETFDVFLTPFKGLRDDGKYRRRLDFAQARDILDIAYKKIK